MKKTYNFPWDDPRHQHVLACLDHIQKSTEVIFKTKNWPEQRGRIASMSFELIAEEAEKKPWRPWDREGRGQEGPQCENCKSLNTLGAVVGGGSRGAGASREYVKRFWHIKYECQNCGHTGLDYVRVFDQCGQTAPMPRSAFWKPDTAKEKEKDTAILFRDKELPNGMRIITFGVKADSCVDASIRVLEILRTKGVKIRCICYEMSGEEFGSLLSDAGVKDWTLQLDKAGAPYMFSCKVKA